MEVCKLCSAGSYFSGSGVSRCRTSDDRRRLFFCLGMNTKKYKKQICATMRLSDDCILIFSDKF